MIYLATHGDTFTILKTGVLALQLPFCFEVSSLSDRLMSSTPE